MLAKYILDTSQLPPAPKGYQYAMQDGVPVLVKVQQAYDGFGWLVAGAAVLGVVAFAAFEGKNTMGLLVKAKQMAERI